ncbi:MAG: hypothetical protein H8D67_18285 [Deltaproteobacteria bacterium]|nr:hypothetical protein [Deltaproteobacteria bacterium]
MGKLVEKDQWVWVVVQDPGGNEQFLGQHDQEKNESFIPTFLEKEEAQQGFTLMTYEKGHKYEVQAILFEDLSRRAAENEFMIFILNSKGEILEKINSPC